MDDDQDHTQKSFLHRDFDEERFRENYGLDKERDDDQALSEDNHYQKEVKRQNLIKMFLHGMEVDKFISTHLYGELGRLANDQDQTINESFVLNDLMNASFQYDKEGWLDRSLLRKTAIIRKEVEKIKKMSAFEAYIALIKGYCGAVLLYASKAFANGGWAWSIATMLFSSLFTTLCAIKLIQIG